MNLTDQDNRPLPDRDKEKLTGIGGWLFTYVMLHGLSAFYNFMGLMLRFDSTSRDLQSEQLQTLAGQFPPNLQEAMLLALEKAAAWANFFSMPFAVLSVMSIYSLYLILKGRAKAVDLTRAYCLLSALATAIFTARLISIMSSGLAGAEEGISGFSSVVSVLVAVAYDLAWFFYFTRSRRVRYTLTR